MPVYVVDSNVFIEAHRKTYPLDVATSFWSKVKELADAGLIISIDKVKNELYDKNDDLENWCRANLPDSFFVDSSTVLPEYGRISQWVSTKRNHYLPNAINEFLDVNEADAFLIAFTLADTGRVLVTHEVSSPNKKNKVKIPEPCHDLGVTYVNIIEMFRAIGETF